MSLWGGGRKKSVWTSDSRSWEKVNSRFYALNGIGGICNVMSKHNLTPAMADSCRFQNVMIFTNTAAYEQTTRAESTKLHIYQTTSIGTLNCLSC